MKYTGRLSWKQNAPFRDWAVCKQLDRPEVTALDGNVYVRPGTPYPAVAAPLVSWVDTNAADCAARFPSLAAFRERVASFEVHGRQLEGDARSVFTAPDIRRYQLRRALPGSGVALPQSVRELLGWSKEQAARTVGAFPAPATLSNQQAARAAGTLPARPSPVTPKPHP